MLACHAASAVRNSPDVHRMTHATPAEIRKLIDHLNRIETSRRVAYEPAECGIARIGLAEGRLQIESKIGSAEIPLKRITHVWRYPDYWVLLTGHSIVMTVPIEGVAAAVSDAWLHELASVGVRVN